VCGEDSLLAFSSSFNLAWHVLTNTISLWVPISRPVQPVYSILIGLVDGFFVFSSSKVILFVGIAWALHSAVPGTSI